MGGIATLSLRSGVQYTIGANAAPNRAADPVTLTTDARVPIASVTLVVP
jgi:hypothetical protein